MRWIRVHKLPDNAFSPDNGHVVILPADKGAIGACVRGSTAGTRRWHRLREAP